MFGGIGLTYSGGMTEEGAFHVGRHCDLSRKWRGRKAGLPPVYWSAAGQSSVSSGMFAGSRNVPSLLHGNGSAAATTDVLRRP